MEESSESLESAEDGTPTDTSEENLIEDLEENSELTNNEKYSYNSKFVHKDEYEPLSRYAKRSSRNAISKKSSTKNGGLEQRISELEKRADKLGVDKHEYVATQLPRYITEYIRKENDEGEDTPNGAVVIIYRKDKKTGKLEFLLEQKPLGYFLQTEEGRISYFGGVSKTTDENSIKTAVRETSEEIKEPAASIIIDALRNNGYKYDRQYYYANGQLSFVDIYAVEIEPENDWRIVKHARTQHDAGNQRILTQNQAIRFSNYFAFDYGRVIQRFIGEKTSARF